MAGNVETVRQNIAAHTVTSPTGSEIAAEKRGNYRGEVVVVSSEASKLHDAAEEIGMSVAHRADRRTLERRDVRQGQGATLEALARIADYYDKLPDMPREHELRVLVENLRGFQELMEKAGREGGRPAVAKEDILRALQAFDPDVSHQFAGLDIAREHFARAGAGEAFMLLLDEVQADYNRSDLAREVKAGFAASEAATRAAATLETDPASVRNAYRELLRESRNMGQLFEAFRNFDVMKNFGEVIDIFMAAAGRDLGSTGPSTDADYLHALLSELGKLKKMQSVVEMSSQLMQTTDRLLEPGERPAGDEVDMAGRLLSFASNPAAGLSDARSMLARYGQCSLATQLAFGNGLRALHGELPDDVAPSPQARLQQNSAILAMLDALVSDEEKEYEEREADEARGGKDDARRVQPAAG